MGLTDWIKNDAADLLGDLAEMGEDLLENADGFDLKDLDLSALKNFDINKLKNMAGTLIGDGDFDVSKLKGILDAVLERFKKGDKFNIFDLFLITDLNEVTYGYCKKAVDATLEKGDENNAPSDEIVMHMFEATYQALVYGKEHDDKWVPADMDLFWAWNDACIDSARGEMKEQTLADQEEREATIKQIVQENSAS